MEQSMTMKGKAATLYDEAAGEMNRSWMDATMEMTVIIPMPGGTEKMTTKGTLKMSGSMVKIPEPPARV
jgi:hypothetical protein